MPDLSNLEVKNIKKVGMNNAGDNLYIFVTPKGAKIWKYRKLFNGKAVIISFGTYPAITVKEARNMRDEANLDFERGIDHRETLRNKKLSSKANDDTLFENIAAQWIETKNYGDKTYNDYSSKMKRFINPYIGKKAITEIESKDILQLLKELEANNKLETLRKTRMIIQQVFDYAIANGLCQYNPTYSITKATKSAKVRHFPIIAAPLEVSKLLNDIDNYKGSIVTKLGLQIATHAMLRPNEIRKARWSYIDFDNSQWKIPPEQMKMREQHIVPLSKQLTALLKQLEEITNHSDYLFPQHKNRAKFMSENTLNLALKRMGYEGRIVAHGFRGMASTLLHENGFNTLYIEKQLAHNDRNSIRASYNHAEYLEQRRHMLQWWSDYLDILRSGDLTTKPEK